VTVFVYVCLFMCVCVCTPGARFSVVRQGNRRVGMEKLLLYLQIKKNSAWNV
jgi:hypothetical protein